MSDFKYSTIGTKNFVGTEVKLKCVRDTDTIGEECLKERFRIINIKEGVGTFINGQSSQVITAPTVLCVNNIDNVKLIDAQGIKVDMLVFDPACFERYIPYESIEAWRKTLGDDAHFFRAFFERSTHYIGVCSIDQYLCNRITQLISRAENELDMQGVFWPCRSRSYFIELLLLVNSIYDEDEANNHFCQAKMTEDIREIVNWLNIHFVEKIVIEDITRQFNTNKTTLNQRFKTVMGMTVTEYLINLRMDVACSCLRKTMLSVKEIISRTGYRDDAHFMRAFKKHEGCTPTEYRLKYEVK